MTAGPQWDVDLYILTAVVGVIAVIDAGQRVMYHFIVDELYYAGVIDGQPWWQDYLLLLDIPGNGYYYLAYAFLLLLAANASVFVLDWRYPTRNEGSEP